jgi:predicted nucleotidyltransferase
VETMKNCYKNWKLNKYEKAAVKTLKAGLKLIPKEEVISIYTGGSFIRREMNAKSDLDLWVITKTAKTLSKIRSLGKKNRTNFQPELCVSGYTIRELKTGKHAKSLSKRPRPNPKRFTKDLISKRLIYGKSLNPETFPTNSDTKDLEVMVKVFKTIFFPSYKNKQLSLQAIIKQVFWLTKYELGSKGIKPPIKAKEMCKLLPKNHIFQEAYKLRIQPTKDKNIRATFIKKLESHINKLSKQK